MKLFEKLTGHLFPKSTVDVQKAQAQHHRLAQDRVKRIFPYDKVREYTRLYTVLGEPTTFGILAAYLRICTLNEAEHQDWTYFRDEVMADDRLTEGDKDVFTEMTADLAWRSVSLTRGEFVPTMKEQQKVFEELIAWKPAERTTEEMAELAESEEAETQAWLSLQSLQIQVESEAQQETERAEEKQRERDRKVYVSPEQLRSYTHALEILALRVN